MNRRRRVSRSRRGHCLATLAGAMAVGVMMLGAMAAKAAPIQAQNTAVQVFVEPDAGAAPLVRFIDAARRGLDAEAYLASSKPVLAALERAAQRGVEVRVLLD